MIDKMVSNIVYLKYLPKGRALITTGDGTEYVTTVKANVSLVAVQEKHVNELLNKKCGCCGHERKCFVKASEAETIAWYNFEE